MCFIFFKQKTAYERRISDCSSDGCSSELAIGAGEVAQHLGQAGELAFDEVERRAKLQDDGGVHDVLSGGAPMAVFAEAVAAGLHDLLHQRQNGINSEERSVGKESASTFRSPWSANN